MHSLAVSIGCLARGSQGEFGPGAAAANSVDSAAGLR
jgi:hypothetical protein